MTQEHTNDDLAGLPHELDERLRIVFDGLGGWDNFDPANPPIDGYILLGGGKDSILIQGEALLVYQQIVFDLTQSAFESGGFQVEAVRKILGSACGEARRRGMDDAVQHVCSALLQQVSQWTIIGRFHKNRPDVYRRLVHETLEVAASQPGR